MILTCMINSDDKFYFHSYTSKMNIFISIKPYPLYINIYNISCTYLCKLYTLIVFKILSVFDFHKRFIRSNEGRSINTWTTSVISLYIN